MQKTTFQLETEIAALTAERAKLMQDVDTALDLQDHAQRAEAEVLRRIGDLMCDWKTGAKTGDDVCVALLQHFSSTPVLPAASAQAPHTEAELKRKLADAEQLLVDLMPGKAPLKARRAAEYAVALAGLQGQVLTITQRPLQPLAQGNYETVIELRPRVVRDAKEQSNG